MELKKYNYLSRVTLLMIFDLRSVERQIKLYVEK